MRAEAEHFPARHWHRLDDGRIECDVCPRACRLHEGQAGLCFVRAREGERMVLTTYGRSSGFILDPIEKKPLAHFYPGTSVLSFGTAGCNLTCKFCQNWDMSKAREHDRLSSLAGPEALAQACLDHGAKSIAFTYNDPVIFLEYAVDVAQACRAVGVETVAVTAGYVGGKAREELFRPMTATNVDLKGMSEAFYRDIAGGRLGAVLETLQYVRHETQAHLEITTLLIPGLNDSDRELAEEVEWIARELGPDVPLHFSAFHPDYKLLDRPPTPPATLRRARHIARSAGLHHVYTGNVHDPEGATTYCPRCQQALIRRDGYRILEYRLAGGACPSCGERIAGRFEEKAGSWGARRLPVLV